MTFSLTWVFKVSPLSSHIPSHWVAWLLNLIPSFLIVSRIFKVSLLTFLLQVGDSSMYSFRFGNIINYYIYKPSFYNHFTHLSKVVAVSWIKFPLAKKPRLFINKREVICDMFFLTIANIPLIKIRNRIGNMYNLWHMPISTLYSWLKWPSIILSIFFSIKKDWI